MKNTEIEIVFKHHRYLTIREKEEKGERKQIISTTTNKIIDVIHYYDDTPTYPHDYKL